MSFFLTTNLRYLRKSKQLSQQELANQLGISRSNVAAYERGNAEPNAQRLMKMANYFDIRLSDFLGKNLLEEPAKKVGNDNNLNNQHSEYINTLQEKVDEVDNMLNSIRKFHQFRLPNYKDTSKEFAGLMSNFDNLMNLCEYLIEENRNFLNATQTDN